MSASTKTPDNEPTVTLTRGIEAVDRRLRQVDGGVQITLQHLAARGLASRRLRDRMAEPVAEIPRDPD